MKLLLTLFITIFLTEIKNTAQENSLVNVSNSPFVKLYNVKMTDVTFTKGFWAERFQVCRDSMVPSMWQLLNNQDISHSFCNFEVAAGLKNGKFKGPSFQDGDFYKWFEGLAITYGITKDPDLDKLMDDIISTISKSQREDGYIHTKAIIEERKSGKKTEFPSRLGFEAYNMGHLLTASCIHYRATGKTTMLNIGKKAADYLYSCYENSPSRLAQIATCPSHYMGVVEIYRTTHNKKYLELAINLINIRNLVEKGTDDNQDRIPFRQQTKAIGHAVRANYLYAGVADVFAETGDTSLIRCLNMIWEDVVLRKLYITGGCGALYNGASPDGTSYDAKEVQLVHQAYGQDFQLPNITAHNESCANIGNLLWNWRMLLITGQAKYADIIEKTLYNSILSGISLDGKRYFYTNPLCVNDSIPYKLRWSKDRESYIKRCNCCPPNLVRTIAEVSNYMYCISEQGIYVNLYSANNLSSTLKDGSNLKISQETDYPWDGKVKLTLETVPGNPFSIFLRIPDWSADCEIKINGIATNKHYKSGEYAELKQKWSKGDIIELNIPMPVKMIEANPLVETNRNQVAVQRGPLVYCLESTDMPKGSSIFDVNIPIENDFIPSEFRISGSNIYCIEGNAYLVNNSDWGNQLYKPISTKKKENIKIKLIPYYAWNNRGQSEMTVWIPVDK